MEDFQQFLAVFRNAAVTVWHAILALWGRFWPWFQGQRRRTQIIVGSIALVLLLALCGTITDAVGLSGASAPASTSTYVYTGPTVGVTPTVTIDLTRQASHPTTTPNPTATSIPAGPPFVGGPYANFTHHYGQPFNDNNWFYADHAQTIIFAVTQAGANVSKVTVVRVPDNWTDAQTFGECVLFLPQGATAFNQTGQYTDYHSSVGEIIIAAPGQGTCETYIAS